MFKAKASSRFLWPCSPQMPCLASCHARGSAGPASPYPPAINISPHAANGSAPPQVTNSHIKLLLITTGPTVVTVGHSVGAADLSGHRSCPPQRASPGLHSTHPCREMVPTQNTAASRAAVLQLLSPRKFHKKLFPAALAWGMDPRQGSACTTFLASSHTQQES